MAYFDEGSPAMLQLESMVDAVGTRNVLYALAHILSAKGDHVDNSYSLDRRRPDADARRLWALANRLTLVAEKLPDNITDIGR